MNTAKAIRRLQVWAAGTDTELVELRRRLYSAEREVANLRGMITTDLDTAVTAPPHRFGRVILDGLYYVDHVPHQDTDDCPCGHPYRDHGHADVALCRGCKYGTCARGATTNDATRRSGT